MEYIEEVRAELHPRSLAHGKRSLLIARTPSQVVGRSYDFFYLRCDYSNDCNVGCKWSLSLNLDRTSLARECSHDVGIRHRRLRQLCFHPRAPQLYPRSSRYEVEQVRFRQALRLELCEYSGECDPAFECNSLGGVDRSFRLSAGQALAHQSLQELFRT